MDIYPCDADYNLHFNMLLLNRSEHELYFNRILDLHFNMLLLNQACLSYYVVTQLGFTFQYASIKPILYRLPIAPRTLPFTFQYASINPHSGCLLALSGILFTFQYASIKPSPISNGKYFGFNLHFNMLLLNRTL